MVSDTHWHQRFEHFESALENLNDAVVTDELSELERAGLIQYFEMTFELAWKTMKDYLEHQGLTAKTPRETIKEAFSANIITNGKHWLEILSFRNVMTHVYDESKVIKAVARIKNFAKEFDLLRQYFLTRKH